MLHELIKLFERHAEAVANPAITAVVRNLHPEARACWNSVLEATKQSPKNDDLTKLLVFARHKVAFHYDPGEIFKGYSLAFISPAIAGEPFVSRGASMAATRFYFADAAGEAYMRNAADPAIVEQLYAGGTPLLGQLNHALRELVLKFINTRGFAWRVHRPTPS